MDRGMGIYHYRRNQKLLTALGFLAVGLAAAEEENRPRYRSVWMKSWLNRRQTLSLQRNLFLDLNESTRFLRCLRMSPEMFEALLSKVAPLIRKKDTRLRKSISAAERLSLTLRHLATGESQETLRLIFHIGQSTISGILRQTILAIYEALKREYLRSPAKQEELLALSKDIEERCNLPNCIGALTGRYFPIEQPNRANKFGVNLLTVVDAQLRFILTEVGTQGKEDDVNVWTKSNMKEIIEKMEMPSRKLPNSDVTFPYFIVGDRQFNVSEHVLTPYTGKSRKKRKARKIFNYRLKRLQRCSENAIGILLTRFQIFQVAMRYEPQVAKGVILATMALHNWLQSEPNKRAKYMPADSIDQEDIINGTVKPGDWRDDFFSDVKDLENQDCEHDAFVALQLKDTLCTYFNRAGSVSWQDKMVA